MLTTTACPVCGYPLSAPKAEGQDAICAYCNSSLIAQEEGVTIPTPIFAGGVGFILGVLLGPALIATTSEGRAWLERQARETIR